MGHDKATAGTPVHPSAGKKVKTPKKINNIRKKRMDAPFVCTSDALHMQ